MENNKTIPTPGEQQQEVLRGMAASGAQGQMKRSIRGAFYRALPEPLRDLKFYGIYKIPILGRIAGAINTLSLFKRIKKE